MDTLEQLINAERLQEFGEGTVVPLGRATVANTASIGALDTRVTAIEQGGGGGTTDIGLSIVDGKLCVTYEQEG